MSDLIWQASPFQKCLNTSYNTKSSLFALFVYFLKMLSSQSDIEPKYSLSNAELYVTEDLKWLIKKLGFSDIIMSTFMPTTANLQNNWEISMRLGMNFVP
jgi:hypothetical protein